MKNNLFILPQPTSTVATDGATARDILGSRIREAIGHVLNRMRLPGVVQAISYSDPVTEDLIEIEVGALFTRLSISGRDYYFDRVTGQFGGTGMGCA